MATRGGVSLLRERRRAAEPLLAVAGWVLPVAVVAALEGPGQEVAEGALGPLRGASVTVVKPNRAEAAEPVWLVTKHQEVAVLESVVKTQ